MLRRACITGVFLVLCCGVLAAVDVPGAWLDVPFVQQQKDGCGAASVAMVMQYWQRQQASAPDAKAEYEHIENALLSRTAHGVFASNMARYFQQNGFSAFTFAGDWDLLQCHLEKGRPLIVALQPGSRLPLHYVVVAGLNPEAGIVLVNDPAERKLLKEDRDRFEREWKAAGHWTLLAVPEAHDR